MGKITRPQSIPEASRLIPEDLLSGAQEGVWVRCPLYEKAHRVSRVGHSSACGRQLVVDEQWYEQFRTYLKRIGGPGADPGEWYMMVEQRNSKNHCGQCAKDIMFDEEERFTQREDIFTNREDYAPFGEPTPADRLAHTRFLSQVALAARLLGAEIVEA